MLLLQDSLSAGLKMNISKKEVLVSMLQTLRVTLQSFLCKLVPLHTSVLLWTSDMLRVLGRHPARCWRSIRALSTGSFDSQIAWCAT